MIYIPLKIVIKILNLKLVIKSILLKPTFQIGLKKFLWLKKLKILYHGHMLLVISMVKKSLEHFTKKNCKKQIKQNLG